VLSTDIRRQLKETSNIRLVYSMNLDATAVASESTDYVHVVHVVLLQQI